MSVLSYLGIAAAMLVWIVFPSRGELRPTVAEANRLGSPPADTVPLKSFSFHYDATPWPVVLSDYCRLAECRLKMSTTFEGVFSFDSNQEYGLDEALDVLNGFLIARERLAVRQTEILVVVDLNSPIPPGLARSVTADEVSKAGRNEFVQVTFQVPAHRWAALGEKVDTTAPTFAKSIESALPLSPHGRVVSGGAPGKVIVMDFGRQMLMVRKVLSPETDVSGKASIASRRGATLDGQPQQVVDTKAETADRYQLAEQLAEESALEYRSLVADEDATVEQKDALRKKVREAVRRAFQERQRLQEKKLDELDARLNVLRRALRSREDKKERIISRRIQELLSNDDLTRRRSTRRTTKQAAGDAATEGAAETIQRYQSDRQQELLTTNRLPRPLQGVILDMGPFAVDFEIADTAYFKAREFKTPGSTPRVVAEEVIAWTLSAKRDLSLESLQGLFDRKGLSAATAARLYKSEHREGLMFRLAFFKTDGDRDINADARKQGYFLQPNWNRKPLRKGEQLRIWTTLGDEGAVGLILAKATKASFQFPKAPNRLPVSGDKEID